MIYHVLDGGAIRTDPLNPNLLVCQLDPVGHTWTEKTTMWESCTDDTDVENGVVEHPEKERIKLKKPKVEKPA
jgi:hypothetical protein